MRAGGLVALVVSAWRLSSCADQCAQLRPRLGRMFIYAAGLYVCAYIVMVNIFYKIRLTLF